MREVLIQMKSKFSKLGLKITLTVVLLCQSVAAYAQLDPAVISVFGDSISLGYNLVYVSMYCGGDPNCPNNKYGQGVLDLGTPSVALNGLLDNSNRPSLVSNLGAGGSASGPSLDPGLTSLHGVGRITSNLQYVKSTYGSGDQYVLILYGTNDHGYDIGPSTTGFYIEQIIAKSIAEGVVPIVGTIPPCSCKNVVPVNDEIIAAALKSYAAPVYLVDHYTNLVSAGWPGLSDPDGVHPNDAGYQFIAEGWFSTHLKSLIKPNVVIPPIIYLLLD